jgi:hypothetical protein
MPFVMAYAEFPATAREFWIVTAYGGRRKSGAYVQKKDDARSV